MIASVQGSLQSIRDQSIVVLVGGVGLEIFVPTGVFNALDGIGQQVELLTHLVVREDSLTLYGFMTEENRRIFELLIGVSGIGPRLGIAVLSSLSPEMLANAIQNDEPEVIARVPGIGKKTAQKIALELSGKLLPIDLPPGLAAVSDVDTEVLSALAELGYSIVEAQAAIQSIPRDTPNDVEERLRIALSYFAR